MDKINISGSSCIIVELKEHKGRKLIHIRKHVKTPIYSGPTKLGIWIPIEKWEEFKEMVNSVEIPEEA